MSLTSFVEQKRQEIAELKQAMQKKMRDLTTAPNTMLKVIITNPTICRFYLTLYFRNVSRLILIT